MSELVSYIKENEKISIRHQCELLEINRSTVYYKPIGESEENLQIIAPHSSTMHLDEQDYWEYDIDSGYSI